MHMSCPDIRSPLHAARILLAVGLLAVVTTAQVSGTDWVVQGKASLKIKGSGDVPSFGVKVSGPAVMHFLPGGDFEIVDAANFVIVGNWVEPTGGLDVSVSQSDIRDFLEENLFSLPTGLSVDQVSSEAKLTPKKNGTGLLVYKLGFVLRFTVDGDEVQLTYKLMVKGTYDLTGASSRGGTWTVDGKQRYSAKKNKVNEDAPLQLVLGPDGGLPLGRFSLRDGGGSPLFDGWCTQVGNKIALLPDTSSLESYVEEWIAPSVDQLFPGGSVSLEVVRTKFAANLKKNGTLALKGMAVFFSELDRGPESGAFKSTYRVVGSG